MSIVREAWLQAEKELAMTRAELIAAKVENERLKREAGEWAEKAGRRAYERDRYRAALEALQDYEWHDMPALEAFEQVRAIARRALTNTTPPPAAANPCTCAEILEACVADGMKALFRGPCRQHGFNAIVRSAAEAADAATPPAEAKKREPGCRCHREEGDSECPVHDAPAAAPPVALRPAREVAHDIMGLLRGEDGWDFACYHDGGPHIPFCDAITARIEADRTQRTGLDLADDECVKCIACRKCCGACDCTGGPQIEPDCTCYELIGGHQPGCYYNRNPRQPRGEKP